MRVEYLHEELTAWRTTARTLSRRLNAIERTIDEAIVMFHQGDQDEAIELLEGLQK